MIEDVLLALSRVVLHFVHSTPDSDRRRSRFIIIDRIERGRVVSKTAGKSPLDFFKI